MCDQNIDDPSEQRKRPKVSGDISNSEKPTEIGSCEDLFPMSQKFGVQRYLVALEYIGTSFAGSQKQPNLRTVQGVLEDAFQKFVGQSVSSVVSSRTDAGVHALMNVFHVDVERISKRKPGEVLPPHEPEVVKRALNHFLQRDGGDVSVIDVKAVPLDFHARFRAQERTYFYKIISGQNCISVFDKDRAWHIQEGLNLIQMQEACKILVGRHDFSSFRAAGCQAKSPIKTLDELNVYEISTWSNFSQFMMAKGSETTANNVSNGDCHGTSISNRSVQMEGTFFPYNVTSPKCSICSNLRHESNGNEKGNNSIQFGKRRLQHEYLVVARAQSFLYHQVRLLVGTLVSVGSGKISTDDVGRILRACSILETPPMAPACGLYLAEVKYNFSSNSVENHTDNES